MNRLLAAGLVVAMTNVVSLFVMIPVPVNVVLTASCIVYLGSARSLKVLLDAPPSESSAARKKRDDGVKLSTGDAMRFPVVGSVFLASVYLLIRYFGRRLVNVVLAVYFAGFGTFAVEGAMETEVMDILRATDWPYRFGKKFSLPSWLAKLVGSTTLDLRLSTPQLACWMASCVVVAIYSWTKHWILNNAIATCLCVTGLESVSVGSFANAAILLGGLFFYDIYWVFFSNRVFGSNVMVTVAKGIDGPIKLLFVRSRSSEDSPQFSLLGLGDLVVPGLFIALLLRFDARRAHRHSDARLGTFDTALFNVGMLAYAAGLSTTLYVMYAFDAAQPALLYLVPAVLFASILASYARGNLRDLLSYSEEDHCDENVIADATATKASSASGSTAAADKQQLATSGDVAAATTLDDGKKAE